MSDNKYEALAEAFARDRARRNNPPSPRGMTERDMLSACAQIEVGGGQYAKAAGKVRRGLAAKLLADEITADTPFHA